MVSGEMIISNDKYLMSEINNSYYSAQMKLIIRNFQKSDLGGYKCISKNSIGDAEGNIRLYGKRFDIFPKYKTFRGADRDGVLLPGVYFNPATIGRIAAR